MNATHLFDRDHCDIGLRPSSESFWTTIFGLFLLHLGCSRHAWPNLDIWEPTGAKPYFCRKQRIQLNVAGLTFNDIAVEPNDVATLWNLDKVLGGICPDIVLRLGERSAMIEAKVRTGPSVNENQELMYPAVSRLLAERGHECMFFVLLSVGHQTPLYRKTQLLDRELGDRFGLLIWEDVFRLMLTSGFQLPGFDLRFLTQFTEDASQDCERCDRPGT